MNQLLQSWWISAVSLIVGYSENPTPTSINIESLEDCRYNEENLSIFQMLNWSASFSNLYEDNLWDHCILQVCSHCKILTALLNRVHTAFAYSGHFKLHNQSPWSGLIHSFLLGISGVWGGTEAVWRLHSVHHPPLLNRSRSARKLYLIRLLVAPIKLWHSQALWCIVLCSHWEHTAQICR